MRICTCVGRAVTQTSRQIGLSECDKQLSVEVFSPELTSASVHDQMLQPFTDLTAVFFSVAHLRFISLDPSWGFKTQQPTFLSPSNHDLFKQKPKYGVNEAAETAAHLKLLLVLPNLPFLISSHGFCFEGIILKIYSVYKVEFDKKLT